MKSNPTHQGRIYQIEAWLFNGQPYSQWPEWLREKFSDHDRKEQLIDVRHAGRYALRDEDGNFYRWMDAEMFEHRYVPIVPFDPPPAQTERAKRDAFEADGFRTEAACQFGFETTNDDCTEYKCDEAALLAFAKACERKGMADARVIAEKVTQRATLGPMALNYRLGWSAGGHAIDMALLTKITEIDAELALILEAEAVRYMTAAGYVRAPEGHPSGALWIKPER